MPNSLSPMEVLMTHLDNIRVSDIIPAHRSGDDILSLEHNQTISVALKALSKRKILSAPLVVSPSLEDLATDNDSVTSPVLVGWVDITTVLTGLISHLKGKNGGMLPHNMLRLMKELESEGTVYAKSPLITLSGGEDRSLLYCSEAGADWAPLKDTIRDQYLGLSADGYQKHRISHRIAVFDAHGVITQIVSQLDIVRYLCSNSDQLLGHVGGAQIQDIGLVQPKDAAASNMKHAAMRSGLVTVDPNMLTLLAFEHMLSQGVSGAPVVSESGDIVANLSVSDLRCIRPEHLGTLALPVAEFVALMHGTTYLGYSQGGSSHRHSHPFFGGSPKPKLDMSTLPSSPRNMKVSEEVERGVRLFTVHPTSTLNEVLHMLSDNQIHRVYITDPSCLEGQRLKGCITPTDILRWVLSVNAAAQLPLKPDRSASSFPPTAEAVPRHHPGPQTHSNLIVRVT
ncbi:hypothetical protein CEUSTIGMA_g12093.t1 [Chlamydomonas eustigma]|uniref:CBS domain-containing protein n=1 Tax=Chlamydomonas eustigma TaxID=1157962 RepID=A0A250XP17_9CHLO|nr:hypothetical protein CEUSTIGMA_g12093.t1 [Chlamydomonas eustigma]|eukprot:GAX84672.1 hypothetical protein CEUSTIGMA_g12093.t1 [Chlamydomonas eustigma]